MSAPAWMPFYPADYLAGTGHLTRAQHGAYLLLILHYWSKGGLPTDGRLLARIARMSDREWKAESAILAEFFDDDWHHPRIEKELEKARAKSEKRAEAGSRGGEAKSLKNHGGDVAIATVLPEQKESFAVASSSEPEKEKKNKAIALSSDEPDVTELMVAVYHEVGAGIWPKVAKLTTARKARARNRLKDCGWDMAKWRAALTRARDAPWLTGSNPSGWRADFDFFMQEGSFTKLLEGSYDARKPSGSVAQPKPLTGSSALLAAARSRLGPIPDGGGGEAGIPRGLDAQRDGSGVYRLADRGH